jgi:hypothetical protein
MKMLYFKLSVPKAILSIVFSTLIMLQSFAQPSQSTMLAKVKSEFDIDLLSHKLIGPGGIDREYRDGFYVDVFTQPFEVVQKSDYPEYPTRYKASLRYLKSGSEWIFEQFTVGSSSYLNVPHPDASEMIKKLKETLSVWMGSDYDRAVGEIENIKFASDPDWYFKKPTEVAFYIHATYSEVSSYTEVSKSEHMYRITAIRTDLKSPWTIRSGSEKSDVRKLITKTKFTESEIKAMKSLSKLAEEQSAAAAMNGLPKVPNAPVFQSEQQLFYYIHEKLLTAPNGPTAEAYLMTVVDESCYENGSSVFFKPYHADWINYVVANLEAYKSSHCTYPGVKHQQYGYIEFLNRNFTSYISMTAKPNGNTWKITDFRYTAQAQNVIDQMKNDDSKCQSKPDLTVKEKVRYQIGDKVTVKFSNGNRQCIIDKIDPNMDNRYFVKIEGDTSGKGYWIEDTFITKR